MKWEMHYEHLFLRMWKQKHAYYIIYLNMLRLLLLKCFNVGEFGPQMFQGFMCACLNQIKVTKYIVLV